MSMYNMLFGTNPAAPVLLAMLGLTTDQCGRFRDCYLSDDGATICIYTRNGGGNRETYMPDFCAHPQFIGDEDDDFDCTYATIKFKTPPEFLEATKKLADQTDTTPGAEKFRRLITDMESGKDNANVSRALEVGRSIFAAIEKNQSTTVSTPEGAVKIETSKPEGE